MACDKIINPYDNYTENTCLIRCLGWDMVYVFVFGQYCEYFSLKFVS